MDIRKIMTGGVAASALVMASVLPAMAASTVVVTPGNTQGWSTADTNADGTVSFVNDTTAPGGAALELTTDSTNTAKSQYMHATDTALSDVTELSYETKQVSGPAVADPSYQLAVDLNGSAPGGFTTLVYEPYWNGTVVPNAWQTWDVSSGQFWSSSTFTDGTCAVVAGAGGPPFYTLSELQTMCPDAQVQAFGVNIGTYNPNYVVETDLVNFNGTTYDFQVTNEPTSKDACKDGGYQNLTDGQGNAFPNQGQCVSYFNHL